MNALARASSLTNAVGSQVSKKWAIPYVGMPFVDLGRDTSGVDCWGLIWLIYKDLLKINLPKYSEYSAKDLIRVAGLMKDEPVQIGFQPVWIRDRANFEVMPKDIAKPFDVLVMVARAKAGKDGRNISVNTHVGIMLDSTDVLHTEESFDAAVQSVNAISISCRIYGLYRHTQLGGG